VGTDAGVSGDAAKRPIVRRRADVVALAISVVVIVVCSSLLGRGEQVPVWEGDLFSSLNGLPDAVRLAVVPVMQVGTVLAIAAVALLFVAIKRRRTAVVVVAAGYGAYLIARFAKLFYGRARPGDLLADITLRDSVSGLGFPSGHSAVSMALVLAVLPYLSGRWRWALLAIPLVVGFARVYVGAHLPLDVVAGWAIGAFAASGVHLILGVPNRSPGRATVAAPSSDRSLDPSRGEG
jgi:membrane-associated phospholipid phosphatase